jgi:urease accessory protein UreF
VQRYLKAVDAGEAHAWHSVVFGLVLAVYSLPLRQGLAHMAYQTLGGFTQAASIRLSLSETKQRELVDTFSVPVSRALEAIVSRHYSTLEASRTLLPG